MVQGNEYVDSQDHFEDGKGPHMIGDPCVCDCGAQFLLLLLFVFFLVKKIFNSIMGRAFGLVLAGFKIENLSVD